MTPPGNDEQLEDLRLRVRFLEDQLDRERVRNHDLAVQVQGSRPIKEIHEWLDEVGIAREDEKGRDLTLRGRFRLVREAIHGG